MASRTSCVIGEETFRFNPERSEARDLCDAPTEITPVGSFTLGWGESVIWDDVRQRLWFVDCEATDWGQVVALYGQLHALRPTPVVALNRVADVTSVSVRRVRRVRRRRYRLAGARRVHQAVG